MVIWIHPKFCHARSILPFPVWVKFSGQLFIFSFHDVKYDKNVSRSQSNLRSSLELYTFKNGFNFLLDSSALRTFKQSKSSNISQNLAVSWKSGVPDCFKTVAIVLLSTCVAYRIDMVEKRVNTMWSWVNLGSTFKWLSSNLVPRAILRKYPWHRMIWRKVFTWFDSSIVKQSELIYAKRDFSTIVDLSDPLRDS